MKFRQAQSALNWELRNLSPEAEIGPPCIDSRLCLPGELFWALSGKQEGALFAPDAIKKGAQAAVVSHQWLDKLPPELPLLLVDDTLQAFTRLAELYRKNFLGKVIAITGSCGKTTAKEIIAAVLQKKFNILKSPASFNNHIGIPYTLCRLSPQIQALVLEMGANHPGEIAALCDIARPQAGLITMVGRAHLEGFGNMAGVAEAKGELFRSLSGEKIAFVNFDDAYIVGQSAIVQKRIGFGFKFPPANQGFARIYRGLIAPAKGFSLLDDFFDFPFPDYLLQHALAAAAIGHFYGVPTFDIKSALREFKGFPGRMMKSQVAGVIFYDDTYNANPSSMKAALQFLAGIDSPGRKFAVLGDMLELGDFAPEEHRSILQLAQQLNFHRIFTLGDNFRKADPSSAYSDPNKLCHDLAAALRPGDFVLFKGSRIMKMENILGETSKILMGK